MTEPVHPHCQRCGWRKGGIDSWNGNACKCGLWEPPIQRVDADPAAGARVLLDGKPGTIVRSYETTTERGYDVDLDDGEARWVSHAGARTRLKDLPK